MLKKLSEMFFGTYETEQEEAVQTPNVFEFPSQKRSAGKVVNINSQLEVVVVNPHSYDESNDIADYLKSKKSVVINLEAMDKEDAKKIVDFTSGVVYALEGNIHKIASGIFLITPFNVTITGAEKDELKNKGLFTWNF